MTPERYVMHMTEHELSLLTKAVSYAAEYNSQAPREDFTELFERLKYIAVAQCMSPYQRKNEDERCSAKK